MDDGSKKIIYQTTQPALRLVIALGADSYAGEVIKNIKSIKAVSNCSLSGLSGLFPMIQRANPYHNAIMVAIDKDMIELNI